jgi:Mn-dependent DtxR family transcriptional regulator
MKTSKSDSIERRILFYMKRHKGTTTMPKLALALGVDDGPVELKIHGKQHQISQAIERLRKRNLIEDVKDRCIECTRADRKRTTVILRLTTLGHQFGVSTELPRQRTLREMTDIIHGIVR